MLVTRLALLPLILLLVLYPPVAYLALTIDRMRKQKWAFAIVNLMGAYGASIAALVAHVPPSLANEIALCEVVGAAFVFYIFMVMVNYWLMRRDGGNSPWAGYLAVIIPISTLILVKYVPQVQSLFPAALRPIGISHISVLFLGLSYVTFRVIHTSQQVRNKAAEMPGSLEYLGFVFFVPTLSTGPISWFSTYEKSLRVMDRKQLPLMQSVVRILVGVTKYIFLSALVNQFTYAGLLRDGHPHLWMDLFIAAYSYTIYLYCNFSGMCDMAIGIAGLLGIDIMENFNQPFHARNLQDFWNRWHITLSLWLRDLLFTPLVKVLARFFGPKSVSHAIAASIVIAFLLIGVWHGVGINFALFGLSQGLGVATVHYYNIYLKKRLGKAGYIKYRDNRKIQALTTAVTITYFTASLFIFANDWGQMHEIFKMLV